MLSVKDKTISQYSSPEFRSAKKSSVRTRWFGGLFLMASLTMIISIVYIHPSLPTRASTTNTAEDNFQRTNTTAGWRTTTNTDGLTNYAWQRMLSNTSYGYIHSNTGTIVYAGVNGHKVAGYVKVPAQQGGDALAQVTFTAVGHGVAGLCLQVTGGTSWYQGDMNTSTGTLELRKRLNGIMTTEAYVPIAYVANTAYWLRLDVQAGVWLRTDQRAYVGCRDD